MIAFLKGLEIYDAWFAWSSLLFRGACWFNILKNISSNLVQDVVFYFTKTYFNSSLNKEEGEIIKPLCFILPQMSWYITYFENGGKNMSFVIKDDDVLDKYNEIWDKIKES